MDANAGDVVRRPLRPVLAVLWLFLALGTMYLVTDSWRAVAAAGVAWCGGIVTTLLWEDFTRWRAAKRRG